MKLSTVTIFKHIAPPSDQCIQLEGDTLVRFQKELVKIAEDIINTCEKENINYHLSGGTALGAIRHNGFIPWDDDMDIDIMSNDFERFSTAFQRDFGNKYWLHTCHTPEYGIITARVRLKGSICRCKEDMENQECGFYIDLFRVENVFNNPILRVIHGVICLGMTFLLSCRNFYKNRKLMMEIASEHSEVMATFKMKIWIGRLLSFMPVKKWAELTQWVYGLCKDNDSKYVTVPAGRKHFFGELRLRCDNVETRYVDFENHKWKVSRNVEKYLTSLYGDYMKIPEEEDREKHIVLELQFPNEDCFARKSDL